MKRGFVIIDNGHGFDTPGKQSPDGRLEEWRVTRDIARGLAVELTRRGLGSALLVPESADVSLKDRIGRVKELCKVHSDAVLVSVHTNASGGGESWGTACGWSVFVAPESGESSRRLAKLLYSKALARDMLGNRCTPPCGYWQGRLAICRGTPCPAVLTENFFHDNRDDVDYLLSGRGVSEIVQLHADALSEYFASVLF